MGRRYNGKQKTKRYHPARPRPGRDRWTPRGPTQEAAARGEWAKEMTPSAELRKAYHRGEIPYAQFASIYKTELAENPAFKNFANNIRAQLKKNPLTMVYPIKKT